MFYSMVDSRATIRGDILGGVSHVLAVGSEILEIGSPLIPGGMVLHRVSSVRRAEATEEVSGRRSKDSVEK